MSSAFMSLHQIELGLQTGLYSLLLYSVSKIFIFYRNRSMSTFSGESCDKVTMSPSIEETHSLGTEVAGVVRHAFARGESNGQVLPFSFHHLSGELVRGIGASLLYLEIYVSTPLMWLPGAACADATKALSRRSSKAGWEQGAVAWLCL